jgi:sodium transport system permease protein
MPPVAREELKRFLIPAAGLRPLAVDLVVLAVLPAICEEALFRGVMLRALLPVGTVPALLLSSLAFGFFHFSFYKLLPTTTLGLLLGLLAVRSRSLVPSMLAHALNNTVVVLLVRARLRESAGRRRSRRARVAARRCAGDDCRCDVHEAHKNKIMRSATP